MGVHKRILLPNVSLVFKDFEYARNKIYCCHTCSFDGIVVASEYQEILLEALQQHQQISIEKDIKVFAFCLSNNIITHIFIETSKSYFR